MEVERIWWLVQFTKSATQQPFVAMENVSGIGSSRVVVCDIVPSFVINTYC